MTLLKKESKIMRLILAWYRRNGRALPWRNISDPYRILLSEIMLQQTQVNRVLEKYPRFLKRFPTIRKLASAKRKDVVIAWQGLGYNNRAVRLHTLAQAVVEEHNGTIPGTHDELRSLPGVGPYTANAMLSSAFGVAVPVLDVNVRRSVSRIFSKMRTRDEVMDEKKLSRLLTKLLPAKRHYDWNQALMDLGAMICTARDPKCEVCPATRLCASKNSMVKQTTFHRKSEPSRDGIPNRIYRGRIVEALRQQSGKSLRGDLLGNKINPLFSDRHHEWFHQLLSGLTRDGLIRVGGNGSLKTQRVFLA